MRFNNSQKTLISSIIFIAFVMLNVNMVAGHFTFPMQVDRPGYNVTIELLQVLGDGSDDDGADLDEGAASISAGNIRINIYLLDRTSQPLDDAEVELSLTRGTNQIGPADMEPKGVGQYSTDIEITEDGDWDSLVRINVPGEATPVVARFTNIPVLPTADSGSNLAPLIGGIVLALIGIIVIVGFAMKRKEQDGTSQEEAPSQ